MKILTWNCNGALRKKFESLIPFNADLIVVQECEDPRETKDEKYRDWARNFLWIGDTKNKGLGVFAKNETSLVKINWENSYQDHTVKHFLPCFVNDDFELLAVWTHRNNSPNFGYVGQFWKYLQTNKKYFRKTIIVGDFNSNVVWDQWDRWWNHSDVVNELKELGIESLYHKYTQEEQGKETQPTFYLHRNAGKSYHIDYCFASSPFCEKLEAVKVEKFENWKHLSDHLPLLFSISY